MGHEPGWSVDNQNEALNWIMNNKADMNLAWTLAFPFKRGHKSHANIALIDFCFIIMNKKNKGYLQKIVWNKLYLPILYMPPRKIGHFRQSCSPPPCLVGKTFYFMILECFSISPLLFPHIGWFHVVENRNN